MKVTVCEMPDGEDEFSKEWVRLGRHVKREGSDLVILPEMPFFHWFPAAQKFDDGVWRDAVEGHRAWVRRLGELGTRSILASRPINSGERRLNEGFSWTEGKGAMGRHHKRYLPEEEGFHEASWYHRGEGGFSPFNVGGWTSGFMICSDLWSMANARGYGKKGVDLIAVPRCTGVNVDKWAAGGRVASIVSGAYCASSNRRGRRGKAFFGGGGWVIDPNGDVLAITSKGRPFMTVNIERSRAERAKTTYPRDALMPD